MTKNIENMTQFSTYATKGLLLASGLLAAGIAALSGPVDNAEYAACYGFSYSGALFDDRADSMTVIG